ncbi:MAG: hypothetical protein IKB04_01105 [Clostridia bacterium]|nr:hypothetical protein [Clostridia bacterium]
MWKQRIAVLLVAALLLFTSVPAMANGTTDLTITALDWTGGDGQVTPGTQLTFNVTVKNTGSVALTAPLQVDISFGTNVIASLTHTGGVAAGASVKLTSQPWAAVAGDKMIAARITTGDSNEKNNTKQSNLRVAANRLTPAYNAAEVSAAGMFDLTFSDDFNDLSGFDNTASGREGYKWYLKRRWAQQDMTTADYSVKNGILTMAYEDDTYTIGASTVDCETHVGYTFNKGYLEARVRIPQPFNDTDSKTAIWSLPIENWGEGLTQGRYVEMDWMEYFGKGDFYGTTLHDMERKKDGSLNWYSKSNGSNDDLNDAAWHVMGWLWENNRLRCYIDGREVYTQTWGPNDIPNPINKVEEGDIQFEGVFEVMDQQNMMLFIAGSQEMPMEFDYVRIWQKGGTAPATTAATKPSTQAATKGTTAEKATIATTVKTTVKTTATKAVTETATTTESAEGNTVTTAAATTTATSAQPQENTPFPWVAVVIPTVVVLGGGAVGVIWWIKKKR